MLRVRPVKTIPYLSQLGTNRTTRQTTPISPWVVAITSSSILAMTNPWVDILQALSLTQAEGWAQLSSPGHDNIAGGHQATCSWDLYQHLPLLPAATLSAAVILVAASLFGWWYRKQTRRRFVDLMMISTDL
ncbi:hypothetical protein BX600DRAFT_451846 [Xylariales sp. PMI_506]|nr:hypothetical protein BX600DRAFT_451846 [Xylariales sp. PMI_506]